MIMIGWGLAMGFIVGYIWGWMRGGRWARKDERSQKQNKTKEIG